MALTDLLAVDIIQGVMDDLEDVTELPQNLLWSSRIPSVPAEDGEIIARYNSRVVAAELIMDDQKAIVRATRPIRTQRVDIPKIKHAVLINESMQNTLARIDAGIAARRDVSLAESYIARTISMLREGIYAREETLNIGMVIDAFSYNKLGINVTNASWGMPSSNKVTPVNLWTNPTLATPIADIQNLRNVMRVTWGVEVDRITMSTQAWNLVIATDEFRAKAALYSQLVGVTSANFPTADKATMAQLASRMLDGMTVEWYDAQLWIENLDGSETSSRYQPANKVILSWKGADNNPAFWDWANAVVPETRPGNVPLLIGADGAMAGEGGFGGEREGPVTYATAADPLGNPPGQMLWAVARGYPRKYKESITGVLTVF